jgi:glycosyltransferase involved in cell wall biosynthesis
LEASISRPRVVVSAVNFTEGGPLTVLRECLAAAVAALPEEWDILALVHDPALIREPRIGLIPFPSSKRSWFHRLYWEWFGFKRISRELKPALWLSLHDITPRVSATRQAVYCHNPAPFYRISLREALLEPKFLAFNLLYAFLYRVFIHRNAFVIVQQNWLRTEFKRRMGPLPVVVAHPSLQAAEHSLVQPSEGTVVFLYPALPRVFKNIETLCEATRCLAARGVGGFEVRLTLDGGENRYARWIHRRFANTPQVRFIGRQTADQMTDQYREATAVVFPSKLETWGLPISEGKAHGRPLLVPDLPYARETVGNYDLVSFFPVESAESLAGLMEAIVDRTWRPTGNHPADPEAPFSPDWPTLWGILTKGLLSAPPAGRNEAS